MSRLPRRPALFGAVAAAVAVAVVAAVALMPAAHADEIEQPAPDPVTSLTLGEICGDSCPTFGAKALVPPDMLTVPGFDGFGLGFGEGLRIPAGSTAAAQRSAGEILLAMLQAKANMQRAKDNLLREFGDSTVELASVGDPLFANYKLKDGTPTAGQPDGESAGGTSGSTSYELTAKGNNLSFGCTARVRVGGETADVNANWSFMAGNGGPSDGRMGLNSHIRLFGERLKLDLSGIASFSGTNSYNVSVNGSAFTFGFSGTLPNGMSYSVSGAVSSNGDVLGFSLGGTIDVGGFPVQIRVDLKPGTVGVGSELAPGLQIIGTVSGSSSRFGVKVDLAVFGEWLQGMVSAGQ